MSVYEAPDDSRGLVSRMLAAVDRWASRPLTGLLVVAVAMAWIALSAAEGLRAIHRDPPVSDSI